MGNAIGQLFVDVSLLPENGYGFFQMLFLGGAYSYILCIGGDLIKQGSELLLLVPSVAGLVGAVVLPVLGAVPDGAIVLFSGLGDNAQKQLEVGIGALAGATTMMLTLLFAMALVAGRVDIDEDGHGKYRRPKDAGKEWSKISKDFFDTGVNVTSAIKHSAYAMVITMVAMLVIQIPAMFAKCTLTDEFSDCKTPKWAALAAGILCTVSFIAYLVFQFWHAGEDVVIEQKIRLTQQKTLAHRIMSARAMFGLDIIQQEQQRQQQRQQHLHQQQQQQQATGDATDHQNGRHPSAGTGPSSPSKRQHNLWGTDPEALHLFGDHRFITPQESSPGGTVAPTEPLLHPSHRMRKFERMIHRIFLKYDKDKSGAIERGDLVVLLHDLGEKTDPESVDRYLKECDKDKDGKINFKEFLLMMSDAKKEVEQKMNFASFEQRLNRPSAMSTSDVQTPSAAPGAASSSGAAINSQQSQQQQQHQQLQLHPNQLTAPGGEFVPSPSFETEAQIVHMLNQPSDTFAPVNATQGQHHQAHPHTGQQQPLTIQVPRSPQPAQQDGAAPAAPAGTAAAAASSSDDTAAAPLLTRSDRDDEMKNYGSVNSSSGNIHSGGAGGTTDVVAVQIADATVRARGRHGGGGGDASSSSSSSSDSEEEDVEVPEDLADLEPEVQRRRVLVRSIWQMSLGTVLVVLFSDPLVEILHELSVRSHIKTFYVAFIIAPLVSSGPEIISSYSYAAKKTKSSATISFSALIGTVCMNNTFCLGIFLFLVVAKDLKWVFTSEVASMVFVELMSLGMVWYNSRSHGHSTYRTGWVIFLVGLLPLALGLVAGLQAAGFD